MTQLDLLATNKLLAGKSALERVQFGIETFGDGAVLLSSMQKTASVLMHLFSRLGVENEILFVDTGFHFHQTLAMRDEYMRRYHLRIITLYPTLTPEEQEEKYGCKLYKTAEGQPVCCDARKGKPFLHHMIQSGHQCVFGGLRRGEGSARADLQYISEDPRFGGYKIHPILDWTNEEVEAYFAKHQVPMHPLHSLCYPSIGCQTCTTPVAEGEDERAGRWRHLRVEDREGPSYCGINFSDGSGI